MHSIENNNPNITFKKKENYFLAGHQNRAAVVGQSHALHSSLGTLHVERGFKGMGLSVSSRSHTAPGTGVLGAQARGENGVCRRPKRKDAREAKTIKKKMKNKVS